eukprot:m.29382 g.29382  ORF g.29382 m.29382 type:complete len:527 (+) comp8097_c0_seq1:174-1754(+)
MIFKVLAVVVTLASFWLLNSLLVKSRSEKVIFAMRNDVVWKDNEDFENAMRKEMGLIEHDRHNEMAVDLSSEMVLGVEKQESVREQAAQEKTLSDQGNAAKTAESVAAELKEAKLALQMIRTSPEFLKTVLPSKPSQRMSTEDKSRAMPIAFLKTHKTGSTTVASLLFRHHARHGLSTNPDGIIIHSGEKALERSIAIKAKQSASRSYDSFISHITARGGKFRWARRAGMDQMLYFFRAALFGISDKSLQFKKMDPKPYKLVSIIRHPADRTRSHFDYYLKSTGDYEGTLAEWVNEDKFLKIQNFQCHEFGLYDEKNVAKFIKKSLSPQKKTKSDPSMNLVMVAERMDLSLILLRRLLISVGWECDLLDLIHVDQSMSKNWNGDPVPKSIMDETTRKKLTDFNPLDMRLWDAANSFLDYLKQQEITKDGDGGRRFEVELLAYQQLQKAVKVKCNGTEAYNLENNEYKKGKWTDDKRKLLSDICLWYKLNDQTFSNFVEESDGDLTSAYTEDMEKAIFALKDAILQK